MNRTPFTCSYRPALETLEQRLPPGDGVLSGLLPQWLADTSAAWAAPGLDEGVLSEACSVFAEEANAGLTALPETESQAGCQQEGAVHTLFSQPQLGPTTPTHRDLGAPAPFNDSSLPPLDGIPSIDSLAAAQNAYGSAWDCGWFAAGNRMCCHGPGEPVFWLEAWCPSPASMGVAGTYEGILIMWFMPVGLPDGEWHYLEYNATTIWEQVFILPDGPLIETQIYD
jgi:hypothetical protein